MALALLLAGCGRFDARDWARVREVTPSFLIARTADDAALASDRHGRVALTWVTNGPGGQDLWLSLSSDSGVTFAPPLRVNPREGGVASQAESRPLPVFGPGGELLVVWSQRRGHDPLVADLVASAVAVGARAPAAPVVINDDAGDALPTYHGFAAVTFLPGGGVFAAWMDHREGVRQGESAGHASSIFYAVSGDGGATWSDNRSLTGQACPCCRPAAIGDADGVVAVAYRAEQGDRREPALAISRDRGGSFALDSVVVADGWRLPVCPVDGPALSVDAAGGGQYAWYSGAGEAGVWIAAWHPSAGLAGARRPLADDLVRTGHPHLATLGGATLIAVEGTPRADTTRRVVAVRTLDPDGSLTPWLFLGAQAGDGWIATPGERTALVCWTEREDGTSRVRVARVTRRGR